MKAMLCVGGCKALRGQMQSFAWTIAMLCVKVGLNWHRKVCPILDKIKGGKTHPTGHLAPRKFLLNLDNSRTYNAFALTARKDNAQLHPRCRYALPWAMCFCAYSACWSMRVRWASSQSKSGTVPFWSTSNRTPYLIIYFRNNILLCVTQYFWWTKNE